jgi:hypothetical protein
MLDLTGVQVQSVMSTTFTWLSLMATVLEVLYRLRCYLKRRAAGASIEIKPPKRARRTARARSRKPVTAVKSSAKSGQQRAYS